MAAFYMYIMATRSGGATYVGVINDLVRRVYEHKHGKVPRHTKRYRIDRLLYFDVYSNGYEAIQREKNIKHWPRAWKTLFIAQNNAEWRDLYAEIV